MIINKQFYFYGDATHTEATQGNLGLSKKKIELRLTQTTSGSLIKKDSG